MPMTNLSEESTAELKKEADEIVQSLNRCAGYVDLEQAISFFQRFVYQTLATSSFEEEEYLSFAKKLIEGLKEKTHDKEIMKLLVNMSRINGDVSSVYGENGLNLAVAQTIAQSPDYFTTPFNSVMIFDYLYSHYYWRAQEIFRTEGFDSFLEFLAASLENEAPKSEEILISLLSSFMSIHFNNDKSLLQRILARFGHIKPIEKKAHRLLSQV